MDDLGLSAADRLALLRYEWDHAYVIWYQAGQFCAMRRDDGTICHQDGAEDLRRELAADHRARPVVVRGPGPS
jgi:hypothetical protein